MSAARNLFDLDGRTALITGGSRGLGLQMAEALGDYGARLVISARKSEELEKAQAHLQARGIPYAHWGNAAVKGWDQIFFYDPDGNIIEVHQVQDDA